MSHVKTLQRYVPLETNFSKHHFKFNCILFAPCLKVSLILETEVYMNKIY